MPSICYLYYSHQDIMIMKSMIKKDENGTDATRRIHSQNLNDVVYYCKNNVECRRVQMLRYFGEVFCPSNCSIDRNGICDNCSQAVSRLWFNLKALAFLIAFSAPPKNAFRTRSEPMITQRT